MKIDWTKYSDLYPDRYIKKSKIDDEIKKIISNKKNIVSLDIGGNIEGTKILKGTKAYFLDPFIKDIPTWYFSKINWKEITKVKFDIIVAKNSFNYLTENEIKLIPKILNKNGVFIANTFIYAREINREFKNTKTGLKGIEKTKYKNGKIYHYLHIGDNIIEHSFFYYDFYKIINFFKGEKLDFQITSPNSMILKITK